MNPARIRELLAPFLPAPLTALQLDQISIYIDLLLRWNSRINLTAVREPEEMATRHFGESLFAARHLLPNPDVAPAVPPDVNPAAAARAVDLGSGAGFPGLPFKIWAPQTPMTLIESNHKKVAFLREVIRALTLTSIDVFSGRAQDFPSGSATIVTLRAVERFASILPTAAHLLTLGGRLALLIGSSQVPEAQATVPDLAWTAPVPVPNSEARVLVVGARIESVTGTKSVKSGTE
jgi:16S rRNA (guanine527-N7)-methyltransferase